MSTRIYPNKVCEGDYIEAHFPCGCVEHGVAVREDRLSTVDYKSKRLMLCDHPVKHPLERGHIITGCAGFPEGTTFYRLTPEEQLAVEMDGTWPTKSHCRLADV